MTRRANAEGKLFVISAPSGCGKTTLCKRLLKDRTGLVHSISMTTRPPRKGEIDGIDYHFVSRKHFQEMIDKCEFLEYEDNFDHLYGTPKRFVEENLNKGKNLISSVDVKGAMKIRKTYRKQSVLIFILPPSIDALRKRLRSRKLDDPRMISARLGIARKEMAYKNRYDYRIVNNRLDNAFRRLKKIIISELNK